MTGVNSVLYSADFKIKTILCQKTPGKELLS